MQFVNYLIISLVKYVRNNQKAEKLMKYRVSSAQADWTLTHTSHTDTEQSTIEASITLTANTD
jgi:hypothetical protein